MTGLEFLAFVYTPLLALAVGFGVMLWASHEARKPLKSEMQEPRE